MAPSDFDSITVEELRELGSVKWTAFPDTIGAFVAEMDFGLAPAISQALHTAVDRTVTGYLPTALSAKLSSATADWYREAYGWDVPAERVHPVPDVIAAFQIAIEHYTSPGSKVIVPTPAYMPFLFVPKSMGREVVEVPSVMDEDGRWTIDLDAVGRALRDGGELVVLCNPHNPLGTVSTEAELLALSEVVDANGGRVFSDEIHAPLIYEGRRHIPYASISDAAAAHTVTAASASKAWNLAGLKCAQVILSNAADEEHWKGFGMMASHGTANMGVIANTAAYTAGRRWLDNVLAYLDENRRLLGELLDTHLPAVGYSMPEGTYIAWLDFRAYGIEGNLAEFFRSEAGVALSDGLACGAVGAGFARFVFAMPAPVMREAIERLARALENREAVPLEAAS